MMIAPGRVRHLFGPRRAATHNDPCAELVIAENSLPLWSFPQNQNCVAEIGNDLAVPVENELFAPVRAGSPSTTTTQCILSVLLERVELVLQDSFEAALVETAKMILPSSSARRMQRVANCQDDLGAV